MGWCVCGSFFLKMSQSSEEEAALFTDNSQLHNCCFNLSLSENQLIHVDYAIIVSTVVHLSLLIFKTSNLMYFIYILAFLVFPWFIFLTPIFQFCIVCKVRKSAFSYQISLWLLAISSLLNLLLGVFHSVLVIKWVPFDLRMGVGGLSYISIQFSWLYRSVFLLLPPTVGVI